MTLNETYIDHRICDFDLDPYEFRIFLRINRRQGKNNSCFESIQKMSDGCRISIPIVKRSLKSLERKNAISAKRHKGQTTHYSVNSVENWIKGTEAISCPGNKKQPRQDIAYPPRQDIAYKDKPIKIIKKIYKKESDLINEKEKEKGLAEFCSAYNSARESKAVKQAYKEAIEGGTCHETIVQGAKAYLSLCRAENREERFIKKPAKWLLDECWEDHIKPQIKLVKKTRVLNFGEESNGIKDSTGLHHGIGNKTPLQRAELYAWYVRVHTSCAPQQHHISYLKSWETHHGRVELKQIRSRAA